MKEIERVSFDFEDALLSLDRLKSREILTDAVKINSQLQTIEKVVVPALERIGKDWEEGKTALSQIYMTGRICESLIDEILPTESSKRRNTPKMAIAVLDDYHMLGKRIVYSILRASGFGVLDLGRVTAQEAIIRTIDDNIQILLISTLMLPSALSIKDVKQGLKRSGKNIKIIAGGAPFRYDDQLGPEVGADAYARQASDAIDIINAFNKKPNNF